MDGIDHVHGGDVGRDGLRVVQATEEERTGEKQKAESKKQKPDAGLVQATEEARAAIRGVLRKLAESAPAGAKASRASAWAWAGLRLVAIVLLAVGVGIGLGDGDEFDDVGCSVAQQPGGTSHGARSAQTRERAGGKLPGSDAGSDGPEGANAETLKAEMLKGETLPGKLLKLVLGTTLEQQAAIERFLNGEVLPEPQRGAARSAPKQVLAERSSQAGAERSPVYVFRWTGRDWKVVCGGGKGFYLEDMLAAKCADYLLHHPNDPISAFELEVAVQPEKGAARARNSIQCDSDGPALRDYRQELRRLQAEREQAQAAGKPEEVARLDEDIRAYESELRGGGPADTDRRAYDNVRKAFGVLKARLWQRGSEERAFAEHLRDHLSIGYECFYSQPEGKGWE
jgi:hypothetical protein